MLGDILEAEASLLSQDVAFCKHFGQVHHLLHLQFVTQVVADFPYCSSKKLLRSALHLPSTLNFIIFN